MWLHDVCRPKPELYGSYEVLHNYGLMTHDFTGGDLGI